MWYIDTIFYQHSQFRAAKIRSTEKDFSRLGCPRKEIESKIWAWDKAGYSRLKVKIMAHRILYNIDNFPPQNGNKNQLDKTICKYFLSYIDHENI